MLAAKGLRCEPPRHVMRASFTGNGPGGKEFSKSPQGEEKSIEDNVSLLWLTGLSQTSSEVATLHAGGVAAGIGEIFAGGQRRVNGLCCRRCPWTKLSPMSPDRAGAPAGTPHAPLSAGV